MAEKTITVDIISKATNPRGWIPIICKRSPATGVVITESDALQLIQFPCLWITVTGTNKPFNGDTITEYFPDTGGGGGGGGGGTTGDSIDSAILVPYNYVDGTVGEAVSN